jgi:hypothetical protein
MKKILLPLILAGFSLFFTCNKSGDYISIQGFHTTDQSGNFLGQIGPADKDWTFMTGLSQAELAFFNFDTGIPFENTTVPDISDNVLAFPNPASTQQAYHFTAADSAIVKLVIVNATLQVVKRTAFKIMKGSNTVQVDVSDRASFPNHTSFRTYFSFSVKDHPDFKAGYGDIRICESGPATNCF